MCVLFFGVKKSSSFSRIMSHSHSSWSDLPPFLLPQHIPSLSHSDEQPLDPRTAGRSGRLARKSPFTERRWKRALRMPEHDKIQHISEIAKIGGASWRKAGQLRSNLTRGSGILEMRLRTRRNWSWKSRDSNASRPANGCWFRPSAPADAARRTRC